MKTSRHTVNHRGYAGSRRFLLRGKLLLAACAVAAFASGAAAPALVVESARAVASIPGANTTAIYLTVRNDGPQSDRLVAAATPAASMVHLHAGQVQGGVSSMRSTDSFDVPARGRLQLRVGGDHLMLMGLPKPLQAGTTITVTLTFENAGEMKVSVPVLPVTGN